MAAVVGGVRIEGLNALVRDLQSLGAEVDDLKAVFAEISALGARYASSFAPKRTGRLAASVRGNRAKNKSVVASGGARVPYAGAINYGWPARNISPSSFMQRADAKLRPVVGQMVDDGIEKLIREKGLQ